MTEALPVELPPEATVPEICKFDVVAELNAMEFAVGFPIPELFI